MTLQYVEQVLRQRGTIIESRMRHLRYQKLESKEVYQPNNINNAGTELP
jgi:hypothetical protein